MKKVTTPLLLHTLGKGLRFPRLFLLHCKSTLGRFKKTIAKRFPDERIALAALPAWVYLNLKRKIGQHRAFEIMRVVLLTGGTPMPSIARKLKPQNVFGDFLSASSRNRTVFRVSFPHRLNF